MGEFGGVFAMLNPVGQDAQHEGFNLGDSLLARRTVGEGTGNTGHLGEPPAISLLFDFYAHGETGNQCPPDGKEAFGEGGRSIWHSGNQEEDFTEGGEGVNRAGVSLWNRYIRGWAVCLHAAGCSLGRANQAAGQ